MKAGLQQAVSRSAAELRDRVLKQLRERLSQADAAASEPFLREVVRALVEGAEPRMGEAEKRIARSHSILDAMARIGGVEDVVFDALDAQPSFSREERSRVRHAFHLLRAIAAGDAQARQEESQSAAVRSEERYLAAVRAAGFALWDWDLREQQVHWSRNVEALFGQPGEPLSTVEGWLEHVHPGDRERVRDGLRIAIEDGYRGWSDRFSFLRSDGTWAAMLGRAWISHDATGRATRVIGGLVDVTEQRRVERMLEEQEQLTRAVAENAASCLFVVDRRGCVTYMNPAAGAVTGYDLAEIRDRPLHDLMHSRREDGSPFPLEECPIHRPGAALREHECTLVRKDGTRFPASCSVTPLYGSDARSAVLEFRDVSEIRKSQEELRRAVWIRDDFLSIASHELRTPLTALQVQIQGVTQAPHFQSFDERVKARLRGAERSLARMNHLVRELLDVSRINAGRLELDPEEMDLSDLVREVMERMEPDVRRTGAEVKIAIPPTPIVGVWDRSRIDQVVCNLLANALKYGEGKPIEIRLDADAERVRLFVTDHGIGIAPSEQQRIFERFERAASIRNYGGFGLGLWIVRRVLSAMGGTIRVVSDVGRGATFEIDLPRRPPTRT